MNLGCQKRLQSTAMTYHASCTHRDTSHDIEDRDQIPRPLCMGIKFPTPGKVKAVKCPGYARGGMLKLRFQWYITKPRHGFSQINCWMSRLSSSCESMALTTSATSESSAQPSRTDCFLPGNESLQCIL